jgi:hypothetical protein
VARPVRRRRPADAAVAVAVAVAAVAAVAVALAAVVVSPVVGKAARRERAAGPAAPAARCSYS